jgi:hypothetical protein
VNSIESSPETKHDLLEESSLPFANIPERPLSAINWPIRSNALIADWRHRQAMATEKVAYASND